MKHIILLFFCAFSFDLLAQQGSLELYFSTNEATLSTKELRKLDVWLQQLPSDLQGKEISISGHTDSRGSDAFNDQLASARCRSVAGLLRTKGIKLAAIYQFPLGEHSPVADNSKPEGMALNRRVMLQLGRAGGDVQPEDLLSYTTRTFDAVQGVHFQSPRSKTTVDIPPGALVYANGKAVQGPVELRFREWRNFYEYLSFGQTMHFHDAGGDYSFNSNGMFEVQASQNGEPVFVAPGQTIDVNFEQVRQMDNVGFYEYNTRSGKWAVPANAYVQSSRRLRDSNMILATAIQPTPQLLIVESGNLVLTNIPDCPQQMGYASASETGVVSFMNAVTIGLELAKGARKMLLGLLRTYDYGDNDREILQLSEVGKIYLQRFNDTRYYFFLQDDSGTFAELEPFKSLRFEYVANIAQKDRFDELSRSKTQFESAYLRYNASSNLYEITISSLSNQTTFKAQLARKDGRPLDVSENLNLMETYDSTLARRWEPLKEQLQTMRIFTRNARVFREGNDEYCMEDLAWLRFFVKNKSLMASRFEKLREKGLDSDYKTAIQYLSNFQEKCRLRLNSDSLDWLKITKQASTFFGAVRLSNFGVFNCDQIIRIGPGTRVLASKFVKPDGEEVKAVSTQIIDHKAQIMLSPPRPNYIYFNPSKSFDVVVLDKDGKFYLCKEAAFKSQVPNAPEISKDQAVQLMVNPITDALRKPEDWKAILGI
ncbi:MAG: OmpA family protein [Chitinophagales bacterium]|nr:OmpA family protein [Chitinophagales bacterium]